MMSGSILKEASFTPQSFNKDYIFENHRRYGKLINILEGLMNSGFVVGASPILKGDIYRYIDEYESEDRDIIVHVLKELDSRNRILAFPNKKQMNDENTWISEIQNLNNKREFDFAIATLETNTTSIIEKVDSKYYMNTGAKIIKQSLDNLQKILAPILSYAEIAKIYDPYFNLSKKNYIESLEIICNELGNMHGIKTEETIDIHTSIKAMLNRDQKFEWDITSKWTNEIKKLENKYGHTISLYIWEETDKNKWHDRWLITNQCGIFLGKGADKSDWTDATFGLLNWEDRSAVSSKFIEGREYYTYIGNVLSSGLQKKQLPKKVPIVMSEAMIQEQNAYNIQKAKEDEVKRHRQPKKLKKRLVPLDQRKKEQEDDK